VRAFYESEALGGGWTIRQVDRRIQSLDEQRRARFERHCATGVPEDQGQSALPAGSSPDQPKRSEARRCERSDLCAVG